MVRIPGYKVLERIGAGASSTVYSALQTDLSRHVAIKVLAPGLFRDDELRERFLREAKLQAKLAHPNLLAVYDAGFSSGKPYLVMELAAGGTLRQWMEDAGGLPLDTVAGTGAAIAAGLAAAHQAGIVHRDLKPENVLLTSNGAIKIADFGLAKADSRAGLHTAGGVILGTPGYLAPEVIRGDNAGPAADIYALGVILYELASGQRLFSGKDPSAVLQAQLRATPETMPMLEAPEAFLALLAACLSPSPGVRPTASAVEERLRAVEGASLVDTTAQRLPTRTKQRAPALAPTRRTRPPEPLARREPRAVPVAALLMVFAVAAAAGGWWLLRPPPPVQVVAPRPSPPPAAIDLSRARVSVGPDRAHLWLGFEAPRGFTVGVRETRVANSSPVPVDVGRRDLLLHGLKENTSYTAVLSGPSGPREIAFRTLKSGRVKGSFVLGRGPLDAGDYRLEAHDGGAGILYNDSPRNAPVTLVFRDSEDGGLTWGEAETLDRPPQANHGPQLVRLNGGWLAAWPAWKDSKPLAVWRFRDDRTRQWSPLRALVSREPGPLLAPAGPDAAWLVTASLEPPKLLLHRLERPFEVPGKAVPIAAWKMGGASWSRAVLAGDRLAVMARIARQPEGVGIDWTHGPLTGAGWAASTPLVPRHSRLIVPSLAAIGKRVLLASAIEDRAELYSSQDGGVTFRKTDAPDDPQLVAAYPAVTTSAGSFYLALLYWLPGMLEETRVTIWRGRDLAKWEAAASLTIFPGGHQEMQLAVAGDRFILAQLTFMEGLVVNSIPVRSN